MEQAPERNQECRKVNAVHRRRQGAAQLSSAYDKTNDGDNAKDMVNYYGYAQGDYKKDGTTTLKTGFSTLLDKTMDKKTYHRKITF